MASLSREALRGHAQTVTGLVDPASLGPTLMHEHLQIELNPPRLRAEPVGGDRSMPACECFDIRWGSLYRPLNFRLNDVELAERELRRLHEAGGRTLVDLTVGGLGPKPDRLAELSRATGMNIVMGSGHYVEEYQDPANAERDPEDFAREIIAQIITGAWGTGTRAGIIGEIGCQSPWTVQERRVMQGALLAQAETGAALNIHPGRHPDQPQEAAEFCRAAGAPMDRVIISHIDRTIFDADRLLRLADTGVVVEFDLFGWEESFYFPNPEIDMPNDGARLAWLRLLRDHGHLDRILISQDICTRTRLLSYGGHGYGHIFRNVAPLMLRRGFTQVEVDRILVQNPRRLLTFT
ncbi:MAG: aryldialkylphosphatase [Azospirillum brasilense]|nr:MAG: aryldialkylphosphatase [Azospirillum brasilense]